MREDFSLQIKDTLAKRVGMKCSNPACRRPTSGPHTDSGKAKNLGEAAHILAASPGGPRYDPSLLASERHAIENGIWLCARCHTLIDSDPANFPAVHLRQWKQAAEAAAQREMEAGGPVVAWPAPDHDVLGIGLKDLEIDPVIGHLIRDSDEYKWAARRPGECISGRVLISVNPRWTQMRLPPRQACLIGPASTGNRPRQLKAASCSPILWMRQPARTTWDGRRSALGQRCASRLASRFERLAPAGAGRRGASR